MRWLYIMRHGHAEEENPAEPGRDEARRLTPLGVAQARAVGGFFARSAQRPVRIVASPWARAARTAHEVAERLALPVESCERLVSHADPSEALDWLAQQPDTGPLLLVSHEPLVSRLAGALVARGALRSFFERAGVAALVWNPFPSGPRGELVFWAPPEVLAPELLSLPPESA